MNDGTITIGTKVDTKGIEDGLDDIEEEVKKASFLDVLKDKTENLGNTMKRMGYSIASAFGKVGKVVFFILSLLLKLNIGFGAILGVVAILGGAFAILLKAIDKMKAEHSEIGQKVRYIAFVINQAIAPAVEKVANFLAKVINFILDAIIKIMAYIGYIVKYLTGYDLFKNAGVDAFQKSLQEADDNTGNIKKNTGGVAKNLKEARKQLAGFDEMNVLSDGSSSGGGVNLGGLGGLGDLATSDWKLSDALDVKNINPPKWLTTFLDFVTGKFKMKNPFKGTGFEEAGRGIVTIVESISGVFGSLGKIGEGVGKTLLGALTLNPQEIMSGFTTILAGFGGLMTSLTSIVRGGTTLIVGLFKAFAPQINSVLGMINPISIGLKIGGLAVTLAKGLWTTLEPYVKPIVTGFNNILKTINPINIGWNIGGKLRDLTISLWNFVKQPLSDFVTNVNNKLSKINPINLGISAGKGITGFFSNLFGAKGMVIKYAKGGIINRPSKGVPLPIGGEHGMEGVVPLTDSQQMMLLGEAIGKYITINANITNSMNGRVLSRELQKIQNEQSFASNRW